MNWRKARKRWGRAVRVAIATVVVVTVLALALLQAMQIGFAAGVAHEQRRMQQFR